MRRRCGLLVLACCAMLCLAAHAAPDLTDGVQVLAMLANPYGANTYLLKNQFELLGWEVTFVGIERAIPACSRLCSTLFADLSIGDTLSETVTAVMPELLARATAVLDRWGLLAVDPRNETDLAQ